MRKPRRVLTCCSRFIIPLTITKTARATQTNQKQALFQNINVNWQTENYRRDGLSDVRVTVNLMPDTGTDAIYGNRLWRLGLYASDTLQGTGTKYAYQRNVLDTTAMQTPLQPPRLVLHIARALYCSFWAPCISECSG